MCSSEISGSATSFVHYIIHHITSVSSHAHTRNILIAMSIPFALPILAGQALYWLLSPIFGVSVSQFDVMLMLEMSSKPRPSAHCIYADLVVSQHAFGQRWQVCSECPLPLSVLLLSHSR